jgi:hypothetical protein
MRPVLFIYDISRAGMHLWVVRKTPGVARQRWSRATTGRSPGKVTGGDRFAIRPERDIILKLENCRSFLDICDLAGMPRSQLATVKRPGPDMCHER